MDESRDTIRFEIQNRWLASEMSNFLSAVNDIYNLRFALEIARDEWQDLEEFYMEMMHFGPFRRTLKRRRLDPALWMTLYQPSPLLRRLDSVELARLNDLTYPQERLTLARIEYASPGLSDLTGIGVVVGHIKDFVQFLIEHYSSRRERNLKNDEAGLRNEELRIENARKTVQLAKELGYSEAEIRQMVHWVDSKQQPIIELIELDKVARVRLLSEGSDTLK